MDPVWLNGRLNSLTFGTHNQKLAKNLAKKIQKLTDENYVHLAHNGFVKETGEFGDHSTYSVAMLYYYVCTRA